MFWSFWWPLLCRWDIMTALLCQIRLILLLKPSRPVNRRLHSIYWHLCWCGLFTTTQSQSAPFTKLSLRAPDRKQQAISVWTIVLNSGCLQSMFCSVPQNWSSSGRDRNCDQHYCQLTSTTEVTKKNQNIERIAVCYHIPASWYLLDIFSFWHLDFLLFAVWLFIVTIFGFSPFLSWQVVITKLTQ